MKPTIPSEELLCPPLLPEQQIAHDELRESLILLRSIYDTAPVALCFFDTELRYQCVNYRMAQLNGQPVEAHIRRTPGEILPELAEIMEPRLRRVLHTGEPFLNEQVYLPLYTEPGTARDWLVSFIPLSGKQNEIIGIHVMIAEVNKQQDIQDALRLGEERLRMALNGAKAGRWEMTIQPRKLFWSDDYRAIYGFTLDEETSEAKWATRIHPDDLPRINNNFAQMIQSNEDNLQQEFRVQHPQYGTRRILDIVRLNRDENGKPISFGGVHLDVTDRKTLEDEAHTGQARLEGIIGSAMDAIITTDAQFVVHLFNRAAERLFRVREREVLGKSISQLVPGLEKAVEDAAQHAPDAGCRDYELVYGLPTVAYRIDGSEFPIEATLSHTDVNSTRFHTIIIRDITERKKAEETIRWQSQHDPLTGLPNRALLHDRISVAIAAAERHAHSVGILCIDLDGFKHVNDSMGHVMGDCLLQVAAGRIASCLSTGDTLARLGGDEFAVLLPAMTNPNSAAGMAQRVLTALASPLVLGGQELFITGSIGISIYPQDGTFADELLRCADAAMYRAKDQGRNGYQMYNEAMNVAAFERLVLENSLRRAVEREELELFFQPQVRAESCEIVGMEALLRWRHPELGLISPARFIPLAEETGIIVPLGKWVLNEACRMAAKWQAEGYRLRVGVNLSPRQFGQREVVQTVQEALTESGLAPSLLELEITEGALIMNKDAAVETLGQLRALGCRMAVDDFGTGYSSLSYLRRFPLDVLKIDRSFVQDIEVGEQGRTILRAVVDLARALGLGVIAEGVETEPQREFLITVDADLIQGYLCSPPVPQEKMYALIKSGCTMQNRA